MTNRVITLTRYHANHKSMAIAIHYVEFSNFIQNESTKLQSAVYCLTSKCGNTNSTNRGITLTRYPANH